MRLWKKAAPPPSLPLWLSPRQALGVRLCRKDLGWPVTCSREADHSLGECAGYIAHTFVPWGASYSGCVCCELPKEHPVHLKEMLDGRD